MRFRVSWLLVTTASMALSAGSIVHCGSFSGSDNSAPQNDASEASNEAASSDDGGGSTSDAATNCDSLTGTCDCDGDPSNGRETNVAGSDAMNCGACGRACLPTATGGAPVCKAGVCVAQPVYTQVASPTALAARQDDVYWGNNAGVVGRAESPGYTPVPQMTSRAFTIASLAVDADNVYVVSNQASNGRGELVIVPRQGACDAGCPVIDSNDGGVTAPVGGIYPVQLTLTSTALLWTRSPSSNDPADLVAAPKNALDGGTVIDQLSGLRFGGRSSLVTDKTNVYAGHRSVKNPIFTPGDGIRMLPYAGCPASDPICATDVEQLGPAGFAADNDTLFFVATNVADAGENEVRARAADGTTKQLVVGRTGVGTVVDVDDKDLYWLESGSGTTRLMRGGKNGSCPDYAPCPQVVAEVIGAISVIALGKTQVFYGVDGSPGGIFRTPK